MRPSASETSSSASRTFSETPSSSTMERARDGASSGTSASMDTGPYGDTALVPSPSSHDGDGGPSDGPTAPAPAPARWQGPVLGLLATGAGLAVAELVVGLVDG